MPHHFKDYSLYPEANRDVLALDDFVAHIGDVRYLTLVRMVKEGKVPSKEYLRDTCAIMLEVEGFPVEAFIRKYASHLPEDGSLFVQVEERVEVKS